MSKKLYFVEDLPYKKAMMDSLRKFKKMKPWAGSLNNRMKKFNDLHEVMCKLYNKQTKLKWDTMLYLGIVDPKNPSRYDRVEDTIYFNEHLSTLGFLYLWGDVMYPGKDYQSFKWAVNLFRMVFPKEFDKIKWKTMEDNKENSENNSVSDKTIH